MTIQIEGDIHTDTFTMCTIQMFPHLNVRFKISHGTLIFFVGKAYT